jgi:hypothetical protein
MRIVAHLGDEGVGANGEIGERNRLRTHGSGTCRAPVRCWATKWIIYRTNPVVNWRAVARCSGKGGTPKKVLKSSKKVC